MTDSLVDLIGPEMAGVLNGLMPSLVRELAELDGSNAADLHVAVHKMQWGDQAVLSAYGLVYIERRGGYRTVKVLPKLSQAAHAAARSRTHWG